MDYCGDPGSSAGSLLDAKIFMSSVISDAHKGARYGTVDIKNYYINNMMETYQYMKIPIRFFTPGI